jgi:hypothetical protein
VQRNLLHDSIVRYIFDIHASRIKRKGTFPSSVKATIRASENGQREMYLECKKRIASYKKSKRLFVAEVNRSLDQAPWLGKRR